MTAAAAAAGSVAAFVEGFEGNNTAGLSKFDSRLSATEDEVIGALLLLIGE